MSLRLETATGTDLLRVIILKSLNFILRGHCVSSVAVIFTAETGIVVGDASLDPALA
jgi:hypothetical protein